MGLKNFTSSIDPLKFH
ncbi:hypothetical protein PUMCH_005137 [Australozyma saopauloensis]|uniref:Uncharacterized protein n=1 Tax=Australozyma saopauloensis TaxID=291208 RepID=A0AAX4HH48_9ASCO|nr:hypothetical protein PUMCH_005137 [[Candida] saopauloensis]